MLHVRTSGLIFAIAAAVAPFAAACSSPTPEPASTTSAAASVATPAAPPNEPTLRFVQSNGIRMRVAEMGKGPLVILLPRILVLVAASAPGSRQGWLSCRCAGFAWLREER